MRCGKPLAPFQSSRAGGGAGNEGAFWPTNRFLGRNHRGCLGIVIVIVMHAKGRQNAATSSSGADEDGAISRQPVCKQTMNLSVLMLS